MSDLHLEVGQHYDDLCIPCSASYLILARDIGRLCNYGPCLAFIRALCRQYDRVFLVLGNHEFFGVTRAEGFRLAESLEAEPVFDGRLTILNRTRVDINSHPDVTILGCTLNSMIDPEVRDIVRHKVKNFQRNQDWTVDDRNAEHARDVGWLREQILSLRKEKQCPKKRIVMITHHAPSVQGTSKASNIRNPWNSASATSLISNDEPSILSDVQWWVFGHTHYTIEFSVGNTKLIGNQRGYAISRNSDQNASKARDFRSIIWRLSISTQGNSIFDVQKVIRV